LDVDVKNWLSKADITVDATERKNLYSKALNRIADQVYALPMFSYVSYLAFSAKLDFPAQKDEFPHLYRATWR